MTQSSRRFSNDIVELLTIVDTCLRFEERNLWSTDFLFVTYATLVLSKTKITYNLWSKNATKQKC